MNAACHRLLLCALIVGFCSDTASAENPPSEVIPVADLVKEPSKDLLSDLQKRVEKLEQPPTNPAGQQMPTVKLSGQLQTDTIWVGQDENNRAKYQTIPDGAAFRRARLRAFGDYGPSEYRVELDFAQAGRPTFLDVYAGLHDLPYVGRVRVGHFFEPFSLERYTNNRYTVFLERGLPDAPFAPARNLGVMADRAVLDQRATWAVGLFRTDSDAFGDDTGTNFQSAVTGRITGLPYYDESSGGSRYLHVGLGYSIRGTKNDTVRFRSQPEARIGATTPNIPNFVDTGDIAAKWYQLLGFELAWTNGPLSFQGEYILTPVSTMNTGMVVFQSWYTTLSLFLTGEHRPYRRENGTFDRVIPKTDFFSQKPDGGWGFGPGAWELALRLSHLDLDNGAVRGGRLTDLTVGVNWYLNPYLRVTANYIHAAPQADNGNPGRANIYGLRMGYDF